MLLIVTYLVVNLLFVFLVSFAVSGRSEIGRRELQCRQNQGVHDGSRKHAVQKAGLWIGGAIEDLGAEQVASALTEVINAVDREHQSAL